MTTWLFSPRGQLVTASIAAAFLVLSWIGNGLSRWQGSSYGLEFAAHVALLLGLIHGGKAAWDAVRAFTFDIDVLMVVAALLAASIGHAQEGALLLVLFSFSGAFEDLAYERTQREVTALTALLPSDALVLRNGVWSQCDATTLIPGEIIKVRPGERVPADSYVTTGESAFDQAAITGESAPREVRVGDELFAGTVNTDDVIEARVARAVKESSVQRILDLVTHARENRQPVQRFIDKLDQPYSIGVMVGSIVIFLVWWKLFGAPAFGTQEDTATPSALYTAITFLIVASPCALVIATPTATLCAIARAAKGGVLFKGGDALARLATTGALALDKTGTLTFGRPKLYEVHPVGFSDGPTLLGVAASLEEDSTHPIATAVRGAARERNITLSGEVTSISHAVARGLEGMWRGRAVRLGSYAYVESLIAVCYQARVRELLEKVRKRGHIGVVVAAAPLDGDTGHCAVLLMADSLRPGAHGLVGELHARKIRPVVMLTGDNATTAERVAEGLNLDEHHGGLLPEDKLHHVKRLKGLVAGGRFPGVGVVGDGINDAPALAAADVSLAMGTIGTAAAMQNADMVLLTESLTPLAWAIDLSRRAKRTINVNITIALSAMVIMALLTLIGSRTGLTIPLWVGVTAHEGGTVLVVLNSLRLLGIR